MNWVFLDFIRWDYNVGTPLVRPLGGSQSALCYLATALARRGERVTTLTGITKPVTVEGVQCLPHEDIPIEVFSPPDTLTVVLNGPSDVIRAIRDKIPAGKPVHIVVLWETSDYDLEWRAAGRLRFEAAYAPEDSVYEQLIDDPAAR